MSKDQQRTRLAREIAEQYSSGTATPGRKTLTEQEDLDDEQEQEQQQDQEQQQPETTTRPPSVFEKALPATTKKPG